MPLVEFPYTLHKGSLMPMILNSLSDQKVP